MSDQSMGEYEEHSAYAQQQESEMTSAIADLEHTLNRYGYQINLMVPLLAGFHRTLQQRFTVLCIKWFQYLAATKYYDGRNEASVKLAQALLPALDDATKGTFDLPRI